MIFKTDSFFAIGSTHRVCQDYAIRNEQCVVVSDGCSSAENSDFGSRFICKAVEASLPNFEEMNTHFLNTILEYAHIYCRTLNLSDEALCATLLIARTTTDAFETICVGDGFVIAETLDGKIITRDYNFESGAPYYLRYELDSQIKKEYFERFGKKGTLTTNDIVSDLPFDEERIYFRELFPFAEYKSIAIASDGLKSFIKQKNSTTTKTTESINSNVIIKELTGFKSYVGEFVQRRCNKALKEFKKQEIQHYDDVSLGVIAGELS